MTSRHGGAFGPGIISANWKVSPDLRTRRCRFTMKRTQTKPKMGAQREAKLTSNTTFSRIAIALVNDITYAENLQCIYE